jgi:Tfp pilus assembly protein PilF
VWAETDPEAANVHHRLGRALFLNKNVDEGFKELVKAREIEASLPNPYVSAAIMYAEMGEQESARKMFDRAVRQEKDDINTLLSYSQWLLQVGDVENAEETLAVARRADPDSLQVLILSGVAAKMAKKRKPAEDYLLAALAQSPANRDVLNQLALVLVEQLEDSKRQRAIEFAKMNTQLYPDASETNITLAWVLYQSGQNQLADQALKKGLQLGSRAPDSSYLVAKMLADQSQNDNAKRLLDEALANKGGIFVYRADAEALRASLN